MELDAEIICFTSGIALLCAMAYFDIIIMDIKMAGLDGMETVHRLRTNGVEAQVIFISVSRDFVFQAFDVEAVHYLVKPVSDQDLFHALDKAVRRCKEMDNQSLKMTKGSSVQVIPFRDILYCEALDHKIYIYTVSEKMDCYSQLETLENQLDQRFFRCHRSYLVNMNFVSSKDGDAAIMVNGDRIPVSRRKQRLFRVFLIRMFTKNK